MTCRELLTERIQVLLLMLCLWLLSLSPVWLFPRSLTMAPSVPGMKMLTIRVHSRPLLVDWPYCSSYGAQLLALVKQANYIVILQKVLFYVPFFPTDGIQRVLVTTGRFYENDFLDEMAQCVLPGSIVFDIGSNIGNHAMYWAIKRNAYRVYAFEPVQSTFAILTRNIELNGLDRRIIPFNVAVSDCQENLSIGRYTLANIGGTSLTKNSIGGIPAITLDSFDFAERKVDFVKIDVEGFERHVITGGLVFLRKTKPKHIFIEIFSRDIRTWMAKTLGALGYSMVRVFADNFLYRLDEVVLLNNSA